MALLCPLRLQLISIHLSTWFKTLQCFKCPRNYRPSTISHHSNSSSRCRSIRILCTDKTPIWVEATSIQVHLEAPPYLTLSPSHQHFKIICRLRVKLETCIKTMTTRWVAPTWLSCLMRLTSSKNHLFSLTARAPVIPCQTMPSELCTKKESIKALLCRQGLEHSPSKIDKLLLRLEVNNHLSFNNYQEYLDLLSQG